MNLPTISMQLTSLILKRNLHNSMSVCLPKRWKEKSEPPFQSELKNPVSEVFGGVESWPEDEVDM